jgi:hypothetical protein
MPEDTFCVTSFAFVVSHRSAVRLDRALLAGVLGTFKVTLDNSTCGPRSETHLGSRYTLIGYMVYVRFQFDLVWTISWLSDLIDTSL